MQLGIDFGTSTTLVSYRKDDSANSQLLDIGKGAHRRGYEEFTIPSVIAIQKNGDCKIGYEAETVSEAEPHKVILLRSLKRCLGCEAKSPADLATCRNPFNRRYCKGNQQFQLFDTVKSAEELINTFMRELLKIPAISAVYNSPNLSEIGISVPAIFRPDPRRTVYNTLLSLTNGAKIINVVNEPTAAILACRVKGRTDEDGLYAIIDVGGGTTDIVVYAKEGDKYFLFKPCSLPVAGDDVDEILLKQLFSRHSDSDDNFGHPVAEVRRAKEYLTFSKEVMVFGSKLTRERFEEIIRPVLDKVTEGLWEEIKKVFDAYKPSSQTHRKFELIKVYLSGGGSKIPLLKHLIQNRLDAYSPNVDFITTPDLTKFYGEDVPIVVVAIGTSMPKKDVSEAIQYMLPYAIHIRDASGQREVAALYSELPVEFRASRNHGSPIELFAIEPQNPNVPVHNLTNEIVTIPPIKEILLSDFLSRYTSFIFKIDKYNFMRVMAIAPRSPNRPFPLPWQGGIEGPLFDKYRKQWRKDNGYD
jgi:actin-like ATPase involved in cell morphogenesis